MPVRHDSPTNTRDIKLLNTLYCKFCIALDPAMDATQSIQSTASVAQSVGRPKTPETALSHHALTWTSGGFKIF